MKAKVKIIDNVVIVKLPYKAGFVKWQSVDMAAWELFSTKPIYSSRKYHEHHLRMLSGKKIRSAVLKYVAASHNYQLLKELKNA